MIRTSTLLVALIAAVVPPVVAAPPTVELRDDVDETLLEAARSGRPVALVFSAAWCPNCRELQRQVLPSPEVTAAGEPYLWVAIDVDRDLTLAHEYEVEAVPQVLLLEPSGAPRLRVVGLIGAGDLAAELERFRAQLESEQAPVATGLTEDEEAAYPATTLVLTPTGYRGRSICFSHVGYGPLALASQSPFQSLRHGPVPRTPSTLARGETQLRVTGTWVNVWAWDRKNDDYLLDYESLHLTGSLGYGLSDAVQLDVQIDSRFGFGGSMDGLIEGFHDLFGIGQAGRDRFPRGRYRLRIDPGNGLPPVDLGEDDSGTYSRTMAVTVQHNVTCGTEVLPALAWSATARWELGEQAGLEGGSGFDLSAAVAASRRWGDWYGYLTLAYTWFGRETAYGIPLEDTQASALVGAEWRFHPRTSAILQLLATQGVAIDLDPFSEPSWEITVGLKSEIATGLVLETGLIENLVTFDNSPDFGVHAGLTYRF